LLTAAAAPGTPVVDFGRSQTTNEYQPRIPVESTYVHLPDSITSRIQEMVCVRAAAVLAGLVCRAASVVAGQAIVRAGNAQIGGRARRTAQRAIAVPYNQTKNTPTSSVFPMGLQHE
jgi:hypothetical protein